MNNDRELGLAGETGIIPRASHWNPEGLRLDGPDDYPYTPDALLSEPNCPSSHNAREQPDWNVGIRPASSPPSPRLAKGSEARPSRAAQHFRKTENA